MKAETLKEEVEGNSEMKSPPMVIDCQDHDWENDHGTKKNTQILHNPISLSVLSLSLSLSYQLVYLSIFIKKGIFSAYGT